MEFFAAAVLLELRCEVEEEYLLLSGAWSIDYLFSCACLNAKLNVVSNRAAESNTASLTESGANR